jgi:capsular exopolysaccharide synthesis family protein
MEIKELALLMWRNARWLVVGLLLGALLALAVIVIQPPAYEASTKVLVNRPTQQTSLDLLPLSEDQLVATNTLLVKTKPVLDGASYQLGTKINPDKILVNQLPNTLIIQIRVQDTDANQAAAIANTLVKILVQENEKLLAGRYATTEAALTAQIDQVQKQITSLQAQFTDMNDASIQEQLKIVNQQIDQSKAEIIQLETDINNIPGSFTGALSATNNAVLAEKQAQLEQARSMLDSYQQIRVNLTFIGQPSQGSATRELSSLTNIQSNIDLYQQIYLKLQGSLETNRSDRQQNTPDILQIDPAVPPKTPLYPMPVLYLLLGSFVGVALSAAAILLMDHVTNPLKNASQTEGLLALPVLGQISGVHHAADGSAGLEDPASKQGGAFRSLGASIQLAAAKKRLSTLMVSNAGPDESKTAIAANLAAAYAQHGQRVILMDGDFRRPHLHTLFGLENQGGLADMLHSENHTQISDAPEVAPGLMLIPTGIAPDQPAGWLDADKWAAVLSELRKKADLVIVDGPSSERADAQMLASKVDAVLLVIGLGETPAETAQAALRRLRRAGANVIGTVLNVAAHAPALNLMALFATRSRLRRKEDHSLVGTKTDDASIVPS